MKRTKIIGTLGPATDSESVLKSLILAGMDVVRFNFSHGCTQEHAARMKRLKKVRRELGVYTATMLDTEGPCIRTGKLEDSKEVFLRAGDHFTLSEKDIAGNKRGVRQTFKGLYKYVEPGTIILIDNGLIELAVDKTDGSDICCTVQNCGVLKEYKRINLPQTKIDLPAITERDKQDLLFGIEQGFDFVAASFVKSADDVREIREFLNAHGGANMHIVAKIENSCAVENIDEIIEASDAVMIARGDLGVEVPSHKVPHLQKKIIKACNRAYKPAIIATQMLDSMVSSPRPTRAEVTDVSNAIYDGADALMLSAETAIGKYQIAAVQTMARIACASEPYIYWDGSIPNRHNEQTSISAVIGLAATTSAESLGASCIIVPTMTGRSARLVSNYRPNTPIYAVTTDEACCRSLQLNWGVTPLHGQVQGEPDFILEQACTEVKNNGFVKDGDICIVTLGDRKTSPKNMPQVFANAAVAGVADAGAEAAADVADGSAAGAGAEAAGKSAGKDAPKELLDICPTNVVQIVQIGVKR